MKEPAVERVHGIKRFGEMIAINDNRLKIEGGEFFSLLGPSGCCKTTTLRISAGFEAPTEGEVYTQGQRMGLTPAFECNTNMVFQNYTLFPPMSVRKSNGFGVEKKVAWVTYPGESRISPARGRSVHMGVTVETQGS
jgi:ABC-type Fe3+/spermidine/putrescine transport system ATPase subunit